MTTKRGFAYRKWLVHALEVSDSDRDSVVCWRLAVYRIPSTVHGGAAALSPLLPQRDWISDVDWQ